MNNESKEFLRFLTTKIYAVDFDNTLSLGVPYPECGNPNWALINFLTEEQRKGHKVILWTCRTGRNLKAAVDWCEGVGLIPDAVNENIPEMIEKYGSDPRKVYAHKYIDDASVAPAMITNPGKRRRQYVEDFKPREARII